MASRLDKARVFTELFDETVEPVRIGRFLLLKYIGGGGMGEIYAARDEQLDREIAIKLVRSDRFASPRADERLLREAQILAKLSHTNVVQIHDAGRFEGRVFIAMELIRGQSLRLWLKQNDKLGRRTHQREILRLFVAAGRGLQAAHAAGLVHRDFKPDNVIVGHDGRPRVVDFGLARPVVEPASQEHVAHAGQTASLDQLDILPGTGRDVNPGPAALQAAQRMTTQGKLLGTPHYMAPEQLRGELVDHRGDQFSFCVALYEALYGQMPFAGADVQELRQSVEEGVLKEPPRGSKVPAPVRRALERGLSPDPNARFLDMGALLMALQGWERRHRRQLVVLALAAAITIGSMLYALMDKILSRPCDDAGAAVTELWTTGRRDSIRRAFASTGLSYAGASWSTLESHIHRYATQLASEMTV